MKTIATIFLITMMVLLPFCGASLFSQTNPSPSGQPEKKVMISKYTIEPDGSETRETIVKKGKAAEDFDVDAYIEANKADNIKMNVRIESSDENGDVVFERSVGSRHFVRSAEFYNKEYRTPTRAFFGVETDQDEDADEPGLTIQIIKGSAAHQAGLKTNDIILSIDGQKINAWEDLSRVITSYNAGDVMVVEYSRLGKNAQTAVILTSRSEVPSTLCEPKGYLGVSQLRVTDKGVAVEVVSNSAAKQAGLKNGDVITELAGYPVRDWEDIADVINSSKPGDQVRIRCERNGLSMESIATIGASDIEIKMDNIGASFAKQFAPQGEINLEVAEKSACPGVYTQGGAMADQQGAAIIGFTAESAAREAELTTGDVIMSVNGVRVKNHSDLWREIITIRKSEESSDSPKMDQLPNTTPDRALKLRSYRAFPNPTAGQVTVEFSGEPVATIVSLYDLSGRQLFREELNAFNGRYEQQFDLAAYAKGNVLVVVQQGDKAFSEQIAVN